jgi:hypothetical protein
MANSLAGLADVTVGLQVATTGPLEWRPDASPERLLRGVWPWPPGWGPVR